MEILTFVLYFVVVLGIGIFFFVMSKDNSEKDYFLGDTVRVQIIKNDYKVTKRLRIKGVELASKPGGYTEKPIFEEVE